MDRGERLDAENRFIENPDDCLIIEGRAVYYKNGSVRTITRRLYELWYGKPPAPESSLYPGPCGPTCHNPRHRVVKGPSGLTG